MKTTFRAFALIAILGVPLSAQPWSGSFVAQSPAANFYYGNFGVGAYDGDLTLNVAAPGNVLADITTANNGFNFWCVDGNGGFQTDATIQLHTLAALTDVALQTKLAKAAYVTTLYDGFGGAMSAANVSNFNAAIWTIMGGIPTNFVAGNNGTVASYVSLADANYQNLDLGSFYYVQMDNNEVYRAGYGQELIFKGGGSPAVIVPEPGTYAMLASGLLGLAIVRRRRTTV